MGQQPYSSQLSAQILIESTARLPESSVQRSKDNQPLVDLVQDTKKKYGILDEDMYKVDETDFTMGVAGSVKVVTVSERRNRPLGVQPGNGEWVTLIAGVNATC